jgi:hypothetical protein
MQTIKEFTEVLVKKRIVAPVNRVQLEIELIKYFEVARKDFNAGMPVKITKK